MALIDIIKLKPVKKVIVTPPPQDDDVTLFEFHLFTQIQGQDAQPAQWDSRTPDGGGIFTFDPKSGQIYILVLMGTTTKAASMKTDLSYAPTPPKAKTYNVKLPAGFSTNEWTFHPIGL